MARAALPGSDSDRKSLTLRRQLISCKSIDKLISDSEEPEHALKKSLGPWSLTALGIGAVIGSGIFTVIGTAMAGQKFDTPEISNTPLIHFLLTHTAMAGRPGAGPALALSLVLVAIVCVFTGLCYAELASMIPIAGSAYTYTYATLGELVAWIIGWDLILEYAFSNMSVSVGFAAHIEALLEWFGIHPPLKWISPAYLPTGLQDLAGKDLYQPGWHFGFNIPAFLVVMVLTVVLVRGIRESARTNNILVLIKMVAILAFIFAAASFIQPRYWHPFMPNGWTGMLSGGSIIFFTYIGFDSVSTAAEECKRPQRDLPFGILATLVACTLLYGGVAIVLSGIVPWQLHHGRRGAGGERAQAAFAHAGRGESALGGTGGADRRHAGHDFVDPGVSAGAGAGVVRHVARPAAADRLQQDSCALPHPGRSHLGGRIRGRHSGRAARHRHSFEPFEYRNAVCVRAGVDCGAHSALSRAGAAPRVSSAVRTGVPGAEHHLLHRADDGAGSADLDGVLHLAVRRAGDLLLLQPASVGVRAGAVGRNIIVLLAVSNFCIRGHSPPLATFCHPEGSRSRPRIGEAELPGSLKGSAAA